MPNRLSESTSLYLRQHADNPVHWQPWDEAALAAAREARRPILLSIGYSACHWCHVMAHESFEDEAIAALMNELYVNIKVDREERPDLDKLYQLAHQLLSGRGGGWPLTVFLEPQTLAPFFAGTYFPPAARQGMPGFPDVLRRVREWYDRSHEEVLALGGNLQQAIRSVQQPRSGHGRGEGDADATLFAAAARQGLSRFDERQGGFGGAPKFPQAPLLAALRSIARQAGEPRLAEALRFTLQRMSRSGLRDPLDGGFYRYCVDGSWTIPHFEKMLYDNALLLPLYAEAAAREDDAWLREVATGIAGWLLSDMAQADGGFAASIDADADGEEGGFHVWDVAEVRALLDPDEFTEAERVYGLDGPPNFEGRAWHLLRLREPRDPGLLDRARARLRARRARRVPPATDPKRLTAWNALAADGLARAGMALGREDWVDAALGCVDFIRARLWRDGELHAVYAEGRATQAAYLDDHAFLLRALLSALEARWRGADHEFAVAIADRLLERFQDPDTGGFFFTADGAEAPLERLLVLQDDATPSGNGVAAEALLMLGHLDAAPRYLTAVDRLLGRARPELAAHPLAHATLLRALDGRLAPPAQVVISGPDADEVRAWESALGRRDGVHCYAAPDTDGPLPGAVEAAPYPGETNAWVCLGTRCLPPFRSLEALGQELDSLD